MKVLATLVIGLTLPLLAVSAASAQQPSQPHGGAQHQAPASGTTSTAPAPGDQAHDMEHMQHMMDMCRQMMGHGGMMGGGMGPGMMREGMMRDGMMGGGMMGPGMGMMPSMMMSGDPKQQAEMMAMRGEMMKAMGDIMLKYAQRAQSAK
jgi:hypothetical protein